MSATDLQFSALQPPSTDLHFGDGGGPVVYIDLTLSAELVAVQPSAELTTEIDNAVSRGPRAWSRTGWQSAQPLAQAVAEHSAAPQRLAHDTACPLLTAAPRGSSGHIRWSIMTSRIGAAPRLPMANATTRHAGARDAYAVLRRFLPSTVSAWRDAAARSRLARDRWITLHPHRPTRSQPWRAARPAAHLVGGRFDHGRWTEQGYRLPWERAGAPAAGKSPAPDTGTPEPVPPCYVPPAGNAVALAFRARQPASLDLAFRCDKTAPDAAIVVPIRSVYMLTNTVTLALADTGQPIPARSLRLAIDVDSWCWSWSASVPASWLATLTAAVGDLVELIATVNGTSFRLAVERISRERSFGQAGLSISGRSRAAWLAEPYADVVSRGNTTAMTAQQLMAAALTDNGVSIGWDIDWQITDWTVPAGAWQHTGTAMDACLAIAEAGGAYIQAHRADQVLRVLPRYPQAPWHWSGLTPDIDLPEAACETEGIEWLDKPAYNTVFVAGQASGILAHVTRQGSAGDRAAPMVTDALITHTDAGRQRGIAILADTGRQALISLRLPVLPETGIIAPGRLLRYSESGTPRLGLTRAVDVSFDFPVLTQTIQIESHGL